MEEEKRLSLTGHLEELRSRLIRAAVYVCGGMALCWIFYPQIYALLALPVKKTLERSGGSFQVIDMMEPFWVRSQISLVGGLILALPFLLLEVWGFVRPGLTERERRTGRVIPWAVLPLFLLGVAFGYWMLRLFAEWLLGSYFILPGMKPMLRLQGTVLFMAKVLLAFGLGFQLPIFIVVLNAVGILPSELLRRRWREAVVVIFIIAAIITPTWDPISMTLAAAPLAVLYGGTVGVIGILDRRRKRAASG